MMFLFQYFGSLSETIKHQGSSKVIPGCEYCAESNVVATEESLNPHLDFMIQLEGVIAISI